MTASYLRLGRHAVVVATVLATAGCRRDAAPPPPGDVVEARPAFEPDPFRTVDLLDLGLTVDVPGNVEIVHQENRALLRADGFPVTTISVEATGDPGPGGSSGRCELDECRYDRVEPCRRIVCGADLVGEFQPLVTSICASIRSTFRAALEPQVRAVSAAGSIENCEENQIARAKSLDGPIADLLPWIAECWKAQSGQHSTWTAGQANVRLERAIDAETRRVQYGLGVYLSGLEGDTEALHQCIDAVVAPLKSSLPAIVDADCAFAFDHRFIMTREPTCGASSHAGEEVREVGDAVDRPRRRGGP